MDAELRYLESLQGSGIRPGLSRMRRVLAAAGHPERRYPAIIVAGTNGKGSTAATLASILVASGYRTGLYTSPHLVSIRERWQIDGVPVSPAVLRKAIRRLRSLVPLVGFTPTYFEALTLLAFLSFEEEGCELAVLEVGMGGRLDATNVVHPLASVITPVGLDHTEWLGHTIRAIAREKAGVIHAGSVAVTSNDDADALAPIAARAAAVGTPLHILGDEIEIGRPKLSADGLAFRLTTPEGRYAITTPLAGAHQASNVALAVRAAELVASALPRIRRATILSGVAATRWRGRLERFEIEGREVWVDGGHNAHAFRRIAPFVERFVPRPRTLVFGVLREKEVEEMAALMLPLFDRVILTEPGSERALAADDLRARLEGRFDVPVRVASNPRRALRAALDGEGSVFVCGSLYLAGTAIELLDGMMEPGSARRGARDGRPRRPARKK